MLVKELQCENAPSPMLVTLSGIVMFVSALQPINAQIPMLVTLLPIVTFVSAGQLLNARISDARHAVGDCYACKRSTTVERSVSDTDYWQSLIFGRNDNIRVRAGSQAP